MKTTDTPHPTTTRRQVLVTAGTGLGAAAASLLVSPAAGQDATPPATPAAGGASGEAINSVQYTHIEKIYFYIPPFTDDAFVARIHGVDVDTYLAIRADFEAAAHGAAEELLADDTFTAMVDSLPFEPGSVVAAIGSSTTDDLQSWFEILRHLVTMRRPDDGIEFVNEGISGQTSTDALGRAMQIAMQQPAWVFCLLAPNDVWRYGSEPTKTLVSIEETEKNLAEIRRIVTSETGASWTWITNAPVDESRLYAFPGMSIIDPNADLDRINEFMFAQPEPVVDTNAVFGDPTGSDLISPDGLHPSLAGQTMIARTVVETLAERAGGGTGTR
ncbi:MAG TPA: SGNH/GDSL hydrolase family protein [Thermomicrobiales bacterium]|nr:SGNH/GDSL hydrolase family protein [Thermomicrobiales bacterium]